MYRDETAGRSTLREMLRYLGIALLVGGVLFLYLRQKVAGRELGLEISQLKKDKAEVIKEINRLDVVLEQLKSPARVIPYAERELGMRRK